MKSKIIQGTLFNDSDLEPILKQEHNKFNKPHLMVSIALSKALTAKEKKIYNLFLRELCLQNLSEFQKNSISLSYSKIAKEIGIKNRTELQETIEKMMGIIVRFEDRYNMSKAVMISGITEPKEQSKSNMYSSDGLEIRFDTKLTNAILAYHDIYAKLDLNEMSKMSNTNAITLYEIFRLNLGTYPIKRKNYTESELRDFLGCNDKYKEVKIFTREIKKAIKEINDYTQFDVTMKRVKEDKINVYKFIMRLKEGSIDINFNVFKHTMIALNQRDWVNAINGIRYKNNTYYLGQTFEDTLEHDELTKEKENPVILMRWNTDTPIKTELATKIWESLFDECKSSIFDFAEKYLDAEFGEQSIEILYDTYEVVRRRRSKKSVSDKRI